MSDFGGRDEPKRGPDDHAELLSELDAHDLALPATPTDAGDEDAFDVDPDADREVVAAYRVPGGTTSLVDVTDEYAE